MVNKVIFGAGCFWCIEACFKDIEGVISVAPGYMGGKKSSANYKDVCTGNTEHVEVAKIEYDEQIISYNELLKMFWFVHDPTQVNRQGNDIGTQYRSVIFFYTEEQKLISNKYKEKLNADAVWDLPIATEISPAKEFYKAEDYHSNYLENNPENPYCQSVVRPKVDKFKKVFSDLVK